jgi:murein L,D-transpeptidase YafK
MRLRRSAIVRIFAALVLALLASTTVYALPRADRIIVHKKEHTLELMHNGTILKTYKIALGSKSGAKQREGDLRTPEGAYIIDSRNGRSSCHRSLHISYPNAADRERARKLGVSPGGDISIHGLPNGYGYIGPAHRQRDWTYGCIAVTDDGNRGDLEAGGQWHADQDPTLRSPKLKIPHIPKTREH